MSPNDPPTGAFPPDAEGGFAETMDLDNPTGDKQTSHLQNRGQDSTSKSRELSGEQPPNPTASLERSKAATVVPEEFGRYAVRRTLGKGGFGAVYLGHDAQLDRAVAIKVLYAKTAAPGSDQDQLLQEARKLAQLRHPAIVAVHDVGVQDGRVYVVSDYLEGVDLGRWFAGKPMPWPSAVRIAATIADALAHAHARLIVHRDVKPGNIIIQSGDHSPVLVDFGLALDDTKSGGSEKGLVAGTPWYMSPEQADGVAHRVDGRTDIYSLGVVLYEMLTGRLPFRSSDFIEVLRQVRDDAPQPPRQLIPDLPPELERICLKAMSKQEQDRYATASDFADALRRILATATASATFAPPQMSDEQVSHVLGMSTSLHTGVASMSSSQRRSREAERRQVTVIVCSCDLFESDTFLELDAEDQVQVFQLFQAAGEPPLRKLGGTLVQCNEQGLLACFGYPVAFEDGAIRAARAALDILQSMQPLREQLLRERGLQFKPWIGIHTGSAIVEAKEDVISLVGDARNVASHLADLVEPGQVVCTETSQRLLGGRFQCESLGPRKIKGVTLPVELFRIQSVLQHRLGLERGAAVGGAPSVELSPLVGRDLEQHLLKDRWEQARDGLGQIVLLVGEPGLGKSRLVDSLKQQVIGELDKLTDSSPIIEWRCSAHFQNSDLYPIREYFERMLGFGLDEPPADQFERLVQHLKKYGLAEASQVPLFASLLTLPLDDRFPSLDLPAVKEREETFAVLRDWLLASAGRRPVVLIVEDLHWIDPSTLEFLEQFLAEGPHDQILTLLTFRPEFKTPWPAFAHQTSLALNRLTRRQVSDLMQKKTKGHLSEALVEQIFDRTGGVPLFVEEFTRMVQEMGLLDAEKTGHSRRTFSAHEIPATLQDLITARLDRMEDERELAQLASVLGREFNHELLAAVANLDEEQLAAELSRLAQAEILYAKGRPPKCTYIFKHALLEDALYNSLVKNKRQQFHARIGETLEQQFKSITETRPELLAYHFNEAGQTSRGVEYWLEAGVNAHNRSADREAIGHLTTGLELLKKLPESRDRDNVELQFLSALGPTYIAVRGYAAPEVGPILLRARELCQSHGESQQLFGIMLGTWEWRLVRGELRLAADLAQEGMELAKRLNDPGVMMEALFMPGATHFFRGQFEAARACVEEALSNYDHRERTKFWSAFTGHDAGVTHRCYRSLILWHLGYPEQALAADRETREIAASIGHSFSLAHAVDFTAILNLYFRRGAEVQTAGKEEEKLGADNGFQLWSALGTLHVGAGCLQQGDYESALSLIAAGYESFRATGAEVRAPAYLSLLGEAYSKVGRLDEARKAFEEGLSLVEKNDDRSHEAELHRLSGELRLAESDDQSTAEECFHKAIEIARQQRSKAWELRATTSLARLLNGQGRIDEARSALTAIVNSFAEGAGTPDLVDAKAVLGQ